MEEVTNLPMADAVVVDNNGRGAMPSNMISSVCVGEKEQIINGAAAIDVNVATITTAVNNDGELGCDDKTMMESATTPISRSASTRKKRSAFSLFRAVFMSFGGSDSMRKTDYATSPQKKAIAADHDDKPAGDIAASWKSLVDGMRPLRLRGQALEYYPPPPPLGRADVYHDVLLPPPSPARAEEGSGMTSRYASAQDLHQMDSGVEEAAAAAPQAEGGDCGGCPHAIDMQAEEFIAKFYEQFSLQKSQSFNSRATE